MAKACIIHRALHQKSLNRNPKESDFNLRAVSPKLNLTPSVKDLHLYTVTVVTFTFPVSSWEHGLGLFTLWPHICTETHTHTVKVSVCACERTFCKNADACLLFTHTQRQVTQQGDHRVPE